jgi:hypothetical protein
MTGVIAHPQLLSAELVVGLGVAATAAATVDLLRLPGWAWRKADESKLAHAVLVLLLPVVGLCLYLLGARKRVAAVAAGGRAASLPFERFGEENVRRGTLAPGRLGVVADPAPLHEFATFLGAPEGTELTVRPPTSLGKPYRPTQRASIHEPLRRESPVPTAGWKADPTGRHQVRFWDGAAWTEDVADRGVRARDTVSS